MTRALGLLLVLLVSSAVAGPVEDFRAALDDLVSDADAFRRAAPAQLRRGGPAENGVIRTARDLHSAALTLKTDLDSRAGSDALNRDLEALANARDTLDAAIPRVRPGGSLAADWANLRSQVDTVLALAAGEAPPARGGAPREPAAPPPVTRVSLIGAEELHFAAADLAPLLDDLAASVGRGRPDARRRAALDALTRLRESTDAIAGAPGPDEIRPEARKIGALINATDRAMSGLGDYGRLRPRWQAARAIAVGIHRFGK